MNDHDVGGGDANRPLATYDKGAREQGEGESDYSVSMTELHGHLFDRRGDTGIRAK
jgi:hypothetical protein